MRIIRWALLVAALGCAGTDPACEEKEPECDSSLVVLFPDDRVDFLLTLSDDDGLDLSMRCPEDNTQTFGAYIATCGGGRLTIDTNRWFSETVVVQVGLAPELDFFPDYQRGGDTCGNPCNTGTIQL